MNDLLVLQQQSRHRSAQNIGWVVLLFSIICVLATYFPYAYAERISDEIWTFRFAYTMALLGVLPAGVIFYLSEFLLRIILRLGNKVLSNQLAIIYGFAVGVVLVSIAEFLIWRFVYRGLVLYSVPFMEFLLPKSPRGFLEFILTLNPFFISSIANIAFSSYLGWKINKNRIY